MDLAMVLDYYLDSGHGTPACPTSRAVKEYEREPMRFAILALLLLAGCGSGPYYWTKPGATPESFATDHGPCFKDATIGYGVGSEKAYKACMLQKGWTRIQGYANAPPSVPHFRGPEDDDEFTVSSPGELMERTKAEQSKGRATDPRCDQPRNMRPPGIVCP
jgi:hypothetical protein